MDAYSYTGNHSAFWAGSVVSRGMAMKVEFDVAPSQAPDGNERICRISYEVTKILLGDEPPQRPAFWKTYRQVLTYNQRTEFNNYRLNVCKNLLAPLRDQVKLPWYFRNGELSTDI